MKRRKNRTEDFYDEENITDLLENDEISPEEEGFMLGYIETDSE